MKSQLRLTYGFGAAAPKDAYEICPPNLDRYPNGSIDAHNELEAIETHLLVCDRCQVELQSLDQFVANLELASRQLQSNVRPGVKHFRASISAKFVGIAAFVFIFHLSLCSLDLPLGKLHVANLIATREANSFSTWSAVPLELHVDFSDLPSDQPRAFAHLQWSLYGV